MRRSSTGCLPEATNRTTSRIPGPGDLRLGHRSSCRWRMRHMFVSDGVCDPEAAVRAEATILHADLDAFYASVEQRDDPRLRGRPVIVGGGVGPRRQLRGEGAWGADGDQWSAGPAPVPDAIVVPPRMSAYAEASRAVFEVFRRTTPLVEGISIDEAFLDVGGLRRISGSPVRIAERLRRNVREQVGLPITVGVARTKFLAKVASAVGKPTGCWWCHRAGRSSSSTRCRRAALGRGKGHFPQAARLRSVRPSRNWRRCPNASCRRWWGRGRPGTCTPWVGPRPRRVQTGRRRRSIGAQHALGRRQRSFAEVESTAAALVDRVRAQTARGRVGVPHGRAPDAVRGLRTRHSIGHAR